MERLFYAILVGILVGVGGAIWVPRQTVDELSVLMDSVQAYAQTVDAARLPAPAQGAPVSWPASAQGRIAARPPAAGFAANPAYAAPTASDQAPAASDDYAPQGPAETQPSDRLFQPAGQLNGAGPDGPGLSDFSGQLSGDGPIGPAPSAGNPAPGWQGYGQGEQSALPTRIELTQLAGAQIIGRVGPEVILASEVLPYVEEMIVLNADKIPPDQVHVARKALMQRRLGNLMENKIIVADARRQIPKEAWPNVQKQIDAEFDKSEIKALMERHKAASRPDLDIILRKRGSSIEMEKRSFAERTLAKQWIHQQLDRKEEITHEELVAHYREHLPEYELEAKARWEQLMVRFERFPDKQQAHNAICQMGNAVLGGAPLAEIAQAQSHGPTAGKGGAHEWTTLGSLVSEQLDHAVFNMPLGQCSPIIEDRQGFHIIRVTERQAAGRVPFAEAQVEIKKKIRDERLKAQIKEYTAKVEKEISVWTIFDEEGESSQQATRPRQSPPR